MILDDYVYEKIYIYGYSNMGRNVYNKLYALYGERVKGILVTKIGKRVEKAIGEGKKIYEVEKVDIENSIVVIATNYIFHEGIVDTIRNRGVQILIYDEVTDDYINNRLNEMPLLETRLLAFCIGQACNLKCKNCVNFAPYAHVNNKTYSLKEVQNDMNRILIYFKEIDKVHIQGGEPFLYKDLAEILRYVKANYNHIVKNVQIATNGSIIPSDDVLDVLSDNYYEVRISNYKNNDNSDKLIKELDKRNINYRMYNFADGRGHWNDSGSIEYKSPEKEDLKNKVARCNWCMCYCVENAIVGRCARSIPAISLQDIKIREGDYLFLDDKLTQQEVSKYFMFINPMECCKYCKGSNGEKIEAAIQMGDV